MAPGRKKGGDCGERKVALHHPSTLCHAKRLQCALAPAMEGVEVPAMQIVAFPPLWSVKESTKYTRDRAALAGSAAKSGHCAKSRSLQQSTQACRLRSRLVSSITIPPTVNVEAIRKSAMDENDDPEFWRRLGRHDNAKAVQILGNVG